MAFGTLAGGHARRICSFLFLLFLLSLPSLTHAAEHDFYRFPLFFGNADAPNTIIMYDNIECPSCRKIWPAVVGTIQGLDPAHTRFIIQGGGKSAQGDKAMLTAIALAEQNQALAREFVTAAFASEQAIAKPVPFAIALAKKKTLPVDAAKLERDVSPENEAKRAEAKAAIKERYGLKRTPSFVINGVVYEGLVGAAPMVQFMKEHPPVPQLP
ncbi:thioredoxin domain-containing protein [Desulfovibrio cuneatus]|uniref:thioredoxin domain-containing protein n=1 Tax=Desulfovibrio cuneatus TaxID=159728 RepID=UPI000404DC17|nr:thioredoxin domain-containing protein [Desulfovibrio cuneatus]